MLVAVTECNKNWKVVRRPGMGDLDSKNLCVCSYLRVSEGGGVCGGPRPCPLPFGPWFVVRGLACAFGSVGTGGRAPSPGRLKRAWGGLGRGYWWACPFARSPEACVGRAGAWVLVGVSERSRGAGSGPRGRVWDVLAGARACVGRGRGACALRCVPTTPPKVGGVGGLRNSALCVPLRVRCCEVRHQPTGESTCKLRPRPPKP